MKCSLSLYHLKSRHFECDKRLCRFLYSHRSTIPQHTTRQPVFFCHTFHGCPSTLIMCNESHDELSCSHSFLLFHDNRAKSLSTWPTVSSVTFRFVAPPTLFFFVLSFYRLRVFKVSATSTSFCRVSYTNRPKSCLCPARTSVRSSVQTANSRHDPIDVIILSCVLFVLATISWSTIGRTTHTFVRLNFIATCSIS